MLLMSVLQAYLCVYYKIMCVNISFELLTFTCVIQYNIHNTTLQTTIMYKNVILIFNVLSLETHGSTPVTSYA